MATQSFLAWKVSRWDFHCRHPAIHGASLQGKMKSVVPTGHPGVYVQQANGNRDLDLVVEAEDGDTALGGIYIEVLVHSTGVRSLQKNLGTQRRQEQRAFRNGQRWERLDRRQKEQKGEETIKL